MESQLVYLLVVIAQLLLLLYVQVPFIVLILSAIPETAPIRIRP